MATPTFRAAGAAAGTYDSSGTVQSQNLVVPSGAVAGDLLIAFVYYRVSANQVSTPAGWTQTYCANTNLGNAAFAVFTRQCVANDPGTSVTFTTTAGGLAIVGVIESWQYGVAVDKVALASNGTPSSSITSATVTTSVANSVIIEAFASDSAGGTLTLPATARVNYVNRVLMGVSDQTQPTAGTSTAQTASTSSGSSYFAAVTLAIHGNTPPNAPTLNFPTNANQPIDRTSTNRFTWTFSDPDAGDSQSAYDLRYTMQGGSYPPTPQYSGTTPNNYLDIPGGTFAAGSYQWQVRTYDSQGVVGPWSSAAFFAAQTPPAGPAITYPTSGGTVNSPDHIDWSYTSQQSYQVQRVADNAGAIDTTTVYYDTGEVTDPNNTIRTQQLTFPTNNRYEWLRLRIKQNNQWSAWVSERVQVSYTPPPVATLTVTVGQPNPAAMLLAISNPAPTGSNPPPPATSNVIEASPDGGVTVEWSRGAVNTVNPNATVPFWTPLSAATYSFRVTARADNGTTSTTGWITPGAATAYGEGAYGAGPYGGAAA